MRDLLKNRSLFSITTTVILLGRIRSDLEPEMVMAFFHALINTDLHKEEIGLQFFPEIMHHLAQFILDGICPEYKHG